MSASKMTVGDLKRLVEKFEWEQIDDGTQVNFIERNYGSQMEYSISNDYFIHSGKLYLKEYDQEGYFSRD